MAAFSESEINEAKERVRRMKERASAYIDTQEKEDENKNKNNPVHDVKNDLDHRGEERERRGEQKEEINRKNSESLEQKQNQDGENEDQSFIILMLILLLSQEGADNALLLALLYLLF